MKKTIIIAIGLIFLSLTANAKEKLYVLNSESTGGSFNAQMTAYAEDLKQYYDVEYIQGRGCNKASAVIKNVVDKGEQVFYIWDGLRIADYLNGLNPLCGKLPNKNNFVNSVLKYGLFVTDSNGIKKEDIFKPGLKVGYNSNTNKTYLEALAKLHGVEWQLVQYEHSKSVILGVLNQEVEWAMINSASSYFQQSARLKALYTLNPKGESNIPPLAIVSKFSGADAGVADLFLLEGGDNLKLRKHVSEILSNPKSKTSIWYNTANVYTQTIDLNLTNGVERSMKEISHWVYNKK